MLCEICGKNEADVHVNAICSDGEIKERNICHDCLMRQRNEMMGAMGLAKALGALFGIGQESSEQSAPELCCEACGMSGAEFEKNHTLGCPDCYSVFRERIEEILIKKNHSALYAGSIRNDGTVRLGRLRRELEVAISEENYEEAAVLRDKIRALSGDGK